MTPKPQPSSPTPQDPSGKEPTTPQDPAAPSSLRSERFTSAKVKTGRSPVAYQSVEDLVHTTQAESLTAPDVSVVDPNQSLYPLMLLATGIIVGVGLILQNAWIGLPAAMVALFLSLRVLWFPLQTVLRTWLGLRYQQWLLAVATGLLAMIAIAQFTGMTRLLWRWGQQMNWDAFGALAEGFGALGQIAVAFLALYVAWRQYIITKTLTQQQNRITQQQTIDAYFQGISDLVLDEEGLLEDWPPERAIAEGRTAAILSGLDPQGKAKVIRFLASSKLLTPLKRDRRLGRPIFDGLGGYEEDIEYGVRVIDLGNMLVHANFMGTDLRWSDLSEANLTGANLQACNLARANLSRSVLRAADLKHADLTRTRLFYGTPEKATPRDRIHPPNYSTGSQTGAIVENADFTNVRGLSEEQRYYCCAWGGSQTRATIPGGCGEIPNLLEQ